MDSNTRITVIHDVREPYCPTPPRDDASVHHRTLYVPFVSPPTPTPSPGPSRTSFNNTLQNQNGPLVHVNSEMNLDLNDIARTSLREFAALNTLGPAARRRYLALLLAACTPTELLFISTALAPMLTRDFLAELPLEIALHVLGFVDDHQTLLSAGRVSRQWRKLCGEELVWKGLVEGYGYDGEVEKARMVAEDLQEPCLLYRTGFQYCQTSEMNRRSGGRIIGAYRAPTLAPEESGVVTSLALGASTVVVGLANSTIQTFDVCTGARTRSLKGHTAGVWAVCLVEPGGRWAGGPEGDEDEDDLTPHQHQQYHEDSDDGRNSTAEMSMETQGLPGSPLPAPAPALALASALVSSSSSSARSPPRLSASASASSSEPRSPRRRRPAPALHDLGTLEYPHPVEPKSSDAAFASDGWGQPNTLVVSGGCDKNVRVWELPSGRCIHKLRGHTSTIRCLRVLHGRPVAISGSRDGTLRVWDIRKGKQLRALAGHTDSVRALDVFGNRAVSGSYDRTCRIWDVDTGECVHVLHGHYHQIYVVVFDGVRVASAGLDTTVRIWDAETGECTALLQGHTALVCQLQLNPYLDQLVTGGSDGRVITFSLKPNAGFAATHKIPAHDSSVTALQLDGGSSRSVSGLRVDGGKISAGDVRRGRSSRLITAGNDGRVRIFDAGTGALVREVGAPSDSVWKVVTKGNALAVCCRRGGKTVTEIWGFAPEEEEMKGLHRLFA